MRSLAVPLLVLALVAWPAVASAAPPEGACRTVEPAHPVIVEQPWAQRVLDVRRTWPHSTGSGVLVAVVDSGVDADHPQLSGKVLPGQDFFLVGDLPGAFDCVSHGTAVASIIAAGPVAGVGFHGVAPDARVLPVRITDRELSDNGAPTPIDPAVLARGIWYAADAGAKVITLSLSGYADDRLVRDAVLHAQRLDALVVAAVGNRGEQPAPSFPAEYDGVLGVGAVDIAGKRAGESQVGAYVDLVAPGDGVVAATRAAGHDYWSGTSFAAPFVAGVAALVRAARPELTAPQVARRLLATANPVHGGADPLEYGAGLVDPYRAVTEELSAEPASPMPDVVVPAVDVDAAREAAWWSRAGVDAKVVAAAVLVAILVAGGVAWAVPRGRRRGWRPARAGLLPDAPPVDEQPEEVFLFPPPAAER